MYKIYKIKKNIFHFNNDNKLELHLKKYIKNNSLILAKCSNSTKVNKFIKKMINYNNFKYDNLIVGNK